jgi:predicted ATP-grasp superfamily ATP-dependent carboligase
MTVEHSIPVLVFGTGANALGVMYELKARGVPIIHLCPNIRDVSLQSRISQERRIVPAPQTDDVALTQVLLDCPSNWEGAYLLPVTDQCTRFVAQERDSLQKKFLVSTPPWAELRRLMNKDLLYDLADSVGVPHPKRLPAGSQTPIGRAPAEIGYPCIVKPIRSPEFKALTGKKVFQAGSEAELEEQLAVAERLGLDVMINEIIPGPERNLYSYRVLIAGDRSVAAELCSQKVRQHPRDFGIGTVHRTIEMMPDLRGHSLALLSEAGYTGYAQFEYKRDERDECFKLIEVNTRQPESNRLQTAAGVDFAYLGYLDVIGEPLPSIPEYERGVYSIHTGQDLYTLKRHISEGIGGLVAFLRPYLRPHVYQIPISLRDPGPFLYLAKHIFRDKFSRRRFTDPLPRE